MGEHDPFARGSAVVGSELVERQSLVRPLEDGNFRLGGTEQTTQPDDTGHAPFDRDEHEDIGKASQLGGQGEGDLFMPLSHELIILLARSVGGRLQGRHRCKAGGL